jgi:outer membrane protein assembly factor BamB
MPTRHLLLSALLLPLLAAPAGAQEWTRFRGPNGTGISSATTVPVTFAEADFNWKADLPGKGHSSPVIWGKKLFITSSEDGAGKRHVFCLNTTDGKPLWSKTYDFKVYPQHQFNSSASSTPAVDGQRVYIVWSTPEAVTVHALDHNGKEAWVRDLGGYKAQHGGASSPIVVGDLLILAKEPEDAPGMLLALDCKTGEVRWKRDRQGKDAPYATPMVYQPKSGPAELIFTSNAYGMTSLDPKTGELNWEMPGIFRARCVSGPVRVGDLIFATAGNGGGDRQAVAVRPGSKASKTEPKVEYQVARGASYVPTPIVVGDLMFLWGDAGIVTCVRAGNGEQVWSERVGGRYFGSPVCVNGKIYAISSLGEVVVIEASDQFKVLGRSNLGGPSHSTPAIADGVMYLRTEAQLISVGGKKASR